MTNGSVRIPAGHSDRPRIVVAGAGFGGLEAARKLARLPVDVTVIDRRNYHLFQPLLYQVATAALSPADMAQPIRAVLRDQRNATVLLDEVIGVDVAARRVETRFGPDQSYDYLILATGSQYAYFGHDDWPRLAPGSQVDRRRDIDPPPRAARLRRGGNRDGPETRQRLLTFVLVGAGPDRRRDGRSSRRTRPRVIVPRLSPHQPAHGAHPAGRGWPARAGRASPRGSPTSPGARSSGWGSKCCSTRRSKPIDRDGVVAKGKRIEAANVIWCAGVEASPVARWLGVPAGKGGRVKVAPDLSVPGHAEIFVIGDAAFASPGPTGEPLPGLAPVAKQQGQYVGEVVARLVRREPPPPPFRYRDQGALATIGRHSAIADLGWIRLTGWVAWILWGIVHILFPDRLPQPNGGLPQLDMGLADLRPRRAADHRRHDPARRGSKTLPHAQRPTSQIRALDCAQHGLLLKPCADRTMCVTCHPPLGALS